MAAYNARARDIARRGTEETERAGGRDENGDRWVAGYNVEPEVVPVEASTGARVVRIMGGGRGRGERFSERFNERFNQNTRGRGRGGGDGGGGYYEQFRGRGRGRGGWSRNPRYRGRNRSRQMIADYQRDDYQRDDYQRDEHPRVRDSARESGLVDADALQQATALLIKAGVIPASKADSDSKKRSRSVARRKEKEEKKSKSKSTPRQKETKKASTKIEIDLEDKDKLTPDQMREAEKAAKQAVKLIIEQSSRERSTSKTHRRSRSYSRDKKETIHKEKRSDKNPIGGWAGRSSSHRKSSIQSPTGGWEGRHSPTLAQRVLRNNHENISHVQKAPAGDGGAKALHISDHIDS